MDDSKQRLRQVWRRAALPTALAALVVALVAFAALRWASRDALATAHAAAEQTARTHHGRLVSELQKFRLLPLVLTEYPAVAAVVQGPDSAAVAQLNEKLELLARRTDAAVIYVIDRNGRTVAASNWRLPTSFLGQDYGFRPYFRDALRSGSAELFALGTVSNRPGLFIARGIGPEGRRTGVIVVKVEFDAVESEWARAEGPTFVTDRNGVVIITSRPEWRFRTTRPLDPAIQARTREAIQYGRQPLQPLALAEQGNVTRPDGERGSGFVAASVPTSLEGASLHFLEPLEPALDNARASAWSIILAAALLVLVLLASLIRAREQRMLREQAQRSLERQVTLRTAELRDANENLQRESQEREEADRRYRAAREELAQANRLSSIGQITAGVAHEINQPVAAIRTFADNGVQLLERERTQEVGENLRRIAQVTERIGAITAELRNFARRKPARPRPLKVATAIDGALLLVGDMLRAAGVSLERPGDETLKVVGDRVRLEQILINLLQNAAEAVRDREDRRVRISVMPGAQVAIDVADSGPGVPSDFADQLFAPFATGREEGLGLGLAIARGIARDLGGDLILSQSPLGGAAFRLTLPAA